MSATRTVDVLVVGAGIGALAAALGARSAGARVGLVGGPRGLSQLASGAWDQGSLDALPPALREPIAPLLREAQRSVLQALGGYRALPFSASDRPLVATAEGTLRRAQSVERHVLDLGPLGGEARPARIAVVGLPAVAPPDAFALARSLDASARERGAPLRFFGVVAEHLRRLHDLVASDTELARTLDAPSARERLAIAVTRAVGELPMDALLLPPVLGSRNASVVEHLGRALGRPVGEVVAARSIQSERLASKLEHALDAIDEARRHEDVLALSLAPELAAHTRGAVWTARAIVLATGRSFAGGVVDARLALADAEAADGVHVDRTGRVLTREGGAPVHPGLFAGGSVLRGLDPARGVGAGLVSATAWLAGRSAAAHAR